LTKRVLATCASTDIKRVIDGGRDRSSGHVVGDGIATTSDRGKDHNDGNDNSSNSCSPKTGGKRNDICWGIAAINTRITIDTDTDTNSPVSSSGGLVNAVTVASAIVRAWLRNILNDHEARGIKVSGAVDITHACSESKRSVVAQLTRRAPRAEDVVGSSGGIATSAVSNAGKVSALLRNHSRNVARDARPNGSIRIGYANTSSGSASAVARAEVAVVEARWRRRGGVAASEWVHDTTNTRTIADTGSEVARPKTAARAGASLTITMAVASNDVALRVSLVVSRDKAVALGIERVSQFARRDLEESVGIDRRASREAEIGVRMVARSRVEIAAIAAARRSETSGASRRGDNAAFSNVATDTSLVTIVANKLEAITMGRVEGQKVKIPLRLSSVVLNESTGGNETNGKRVSSSAKVPSCSGSVNIGGGIGGDGDGKVVNASGTAGNGLGSILPETADLLWEISLSVELPVAITIVSCGGCRVKVGHVKNGREWAATANVVLESAARYPRLSVGINSSVRISASVRCRAKEKSRTLDASRKWWGWSNGERLRAA